MVEELLVIPIEFLQIGVTPHVGLDAEFTTGLPTLLDALVEPVPDHPKAPALGVGRMLNISILVVVMGVVFQAASPALVKTDPAPVINQVNALFDQVGVGIVVVVPVKNRACKLFVSPGLLAFLFLFVKGVFDEVTSRFERLGRVVGGLLSLLAGLIFGNAVGLSRNAGFVVPHFLEQGVGISNGIATQGLAGCANPLQGPFQVFAHAA